MYTHTSKTTESQCFPLLLWTEDQPVHTPVRTQAYGPALSQSNFSILSVFCLVYNNDASLLDYNLGVPPVWGYVGSMYPDLNFTFALLCVILGFQFTVTTGQAISSCIFTSDKEGLLSRIETKYQSVLVIVNTRMPCAYWT